MLSGVSPCATCHTISPLFRSIAVIAPVRRLDAAAAPERSARAGPPSPPAAPPAAARRRAGRCASGSRARAPRCSPCPSACGRSARAPSGSTPACTSRRRAMCVSGSYEPPGQLVPPLRRQHQRRRAARPTLLTTGGVKIGPSLVAAPRSSRLRRCSSGVKSIRSSIDDALAIVTPAAWSGTAASANTTRPARRPSAPAAPRSARPAGRSRDRRRRGTPAWSAARPP